MVEDGKKLYKTRADYCLPDWEQMSKSELCNLYIESNNPTIKDGAISGIIYKCWNIFNHNYRSQPYIPLEDWYDSMIEAILYVLEKHVWTNPDNVLYGKENGPEMALHRCIWSRKLDVYCANNKPKRIINKNIQSIDLLKEDQGLEPECEIDEDAYIFRQYIQTLIQKDKLVYALILDLVGQGVLKSKLQKEIRSLDDDYLDYFSNMYKVDKNLVENTIKELQNNTKLDQFIDYYFTCLQRDSDTLEYLKA